MAPSASPGGLTLPAFVPLAAESGDQHSSPLLLVLSEVLSLYHAQLRDTGLPMQ